MNEEKLKKLEMAFKNHSNLLANMNGNIFELTWDNKIKNYRGKNPKTNLEIGIWELEFLFQLAKNRVEKCSLEVA